MSETDRGIAHMRPDGSITRGGDRSIRGGLPKGGAGGWSDDVQAVRALLAKSTLFDEDHPCVHVIPSTANPAAFGFFGLGLTLFLMMAPKTGMTDYDSHNLMYGFALFFAGWGQFLMGWLEFQRKNTFGCVVWLSYGCYWIATGFTGFLETAGVFQFEPTEGGWIIANSLWGFVSLVFWACSFGLNLAVNLLLLFLAVLFWLEAAYYHHPSISTGLGVFGMVTAVLSFYIGTSIFMSDMYGQEILPLIAFDWKSLQSKRRFGPFGTRKDLGVPNMHASDDSSDGKELSV